MEHAKTVLIIDDDADYVSGLAHLLETNGYGVRTAASGGDGLDLAKTVKPDAILLDVMMDDRTDGFFTLERIRAVPDLSDIPVIVISSIYSDYPVFRVSPESGWLPANLFLPKPVNPARLLAELARLTGTGHLTLPAETRSQPT